MARRVFFSFNYNRDAWRTGTVRSIGALGGNKPASDNDWETIKKGGDAAIKKWIDGQMKNRSCAIVLIGQRTAGRKWIKYEIEKAWNDGKGIFGVYVHNLKDSDGNQDSKGSNPFEDLNVGDKNMAPVVKAYSPQYSVSTKVYDYIAENMEGWIETAIEIRNSYKV